MRRAPLVFALIHAAALFASSAAAFPWLLDEWGRAGGDGAGQRRATCLSGRPFWGDSPRRNGARSAGAALPILEARTPEEVRKVIRLCAAADAGAVPGLHRAAVSSPDPLVAGNAIRALGRLGATRELDMARLLEDPRPRIRQEAIVALGLSGDPQAVARLAPLLETGDPALRPLVIQALGRLGGPEARGLIAERLCRPDATTVERAFARQALARE